MYTYFDYIRGLFPFFGMTGPSPEPPSNEVEQNENTVITQSQNEKGFTDPPFIPGTQDWGLGETSSSISLPQNENQQEIESSSDQVNQWGEVPFKDDSNSIPDNDQFFSGWGSIFDDDDE